MDSSTPANYTLMRQITTMDSSTTENYTLVMHISTMDSSTSTNYTLVMQITTMDSSTAENYSCEADPHHRQLQTSKQLQVLILLQHLILLSESRPTCNESIAHQRGLNYYKTFYGYVLAMGLSIFWLLPTYFKRKCWSKMEILERGTKYATLP